MDYQKIFQELSRNQQVFKALLGDTGSVQVQWKSSPDKWSLLEIVCHLYDEEREDFRARIRHVFETPGSPMPPLNPTGWVQERKYAQQDYMEKLTAFLQERAQSIEWLLSLSDPPWYNAYHHPTFGALTARMFLVNWLAHDYLHFRQITRLKYDYLKQVSGESLDYAGSW